MREVRQIRSPAAHSLVDDAYDRDLWPRQEALVMRVYDALRALRCLMALDPRTGACEVPERLRKGMITLF